MPETTTRIKTTGMHCGSCAMLIRMTVEDLGGVTGADVDLASGLATVTYDPDVVDAPSIAAAIEGAGYGAEVLASA